MTERAGFAVGLVASCALHAAFLAGLGAAWHFARTPPPSPPDEEPLALDLARVDLSFSEEEREAAPLRPQPPSAAAPRPPAAPPPPRRAEPPPLVAPLVPDAVAAASADGVRATALRPPELEAPDAPPAPEPPAEHRPPSAAAAPSAPPVAAPVQARVDVPPSPRRPIVRPKYPDGARRRHEEGDVTLELAVDARGVVVDVAVVASCGFAELERAAKDAVRRVTFRPARRGGRAVGSTARLTMTFRLSESR